MTNKDEIKNQAISEDELEEVAGGGCWFGAKAVAPNGHDIGCHFSHSWYESWDEYKYDVGICKYCGGELKSAQHYSSKEIKWCKDCGKGNGNEW